MRGAESDEARGARLQRYAKEANNLMSPSYGLDGLDAVPLDLARGYAQAYLQNAHAAGVAEGIATAASARAAASTRGAAGSPSGQPSGSGASMASMGDVKNDSGETATDTTDTRGDPLLGAVDPETHDVLISAVIRMLLALTPRRGTLGSSDDARLARAARVIDAVCFSALSQEAEDGFRVVQDWADDYYRRRRGFIHLPPDGHHVRDAVWRELGEQSQPADLDGAARAHVDFKTAAKGRSEVVTAAALCSVADVVLGELRRIDLSESTRAHLTSRVQRAYSAFHGDPDDRRLAVLVALQLACLEPVPLGRGSSDDDLLARIIHGFSARAEW